MMKSWPLINGSLVSAVLLTLVLGVGPAYGQLDEASTVTAAMRVVMLAQAGQYAEAIPLAQQLLAFDEKALGPDHPTVAVVLTTLAWLYRARGDDTQAMPLCQRALAIDEKTLGPDHPDVAGVLNDLAGVYADMGAYAQAGPLYQRALAILENAHGPDHLDVLSVLNNLAWLYWAQGDDTQAVPLYQQALAIWEKKAIRLNHQAVTQTASNLAGLYRTPCWPLWRCGR